MKKAFYILSLACCFLVSACSLRPSVSTPSTQPLPPAPVISKLNLYQVILDGSQTNHTGAKAIIGCNDSLVSLPVDSQIAVSNKYTETWNLFTSYDSPQAGYINPRKSQTQVSFRSYEINGKTLIINLNGSLMLGGACELPRLEETAKATFRQFGFEDIKVMIDGKDIHTIAQ